MITNISPNHLDWHETYEHYAASKSAICASTIACSAPRLVEPEEHLLEAINSALRLSIPGEHNLENARLADAGCAHAPSGTWRTQHGNPSTRGGFCFTPWGFPGTPSPIEPPGHLWWCGMHQRLKIDDAGVDSPSCGRIRGFHSSSPACRWIRQGKRCFSNRGSCATIGRALRNRHYGPSNCRRWWHALWHDQ